MRITESGVTMVTTDERRFLWAVFAALTAQSWIGEPGTMPVDPNPTDLELRQLTRDISDGMDLEPDEVDEWMRNLHIY